MGHALETEGDSKGYAENRSPVRREHRSV